MRFSPFVRPFHPSFRFIIADQPQWQQHERAVVNAAFPNLRACIAKDLNPAKIYPEYEIAPRFTAELQILKHTTLACLSPILRHPLEWRFYGHGGVTTYISRILDISLLTFAPKTSLSVNGNQQTLFRPSAQDGLRTLKFESAPERPTIDVMEACVRAVQAVPHFLLPKEAGNSAQRKHRLTIVCERMLDLEIWKLQVWHDRRHISTSTSANCIFPQLPYLVRTNPYLYPQAQVHLAGAVTPQEFIGYAHSFSHIYQTLWHDVFHARDDDRDTAVVLFELLVSTNGIKEEQYAATFTRLPGQIGFHGSLEEYPAGDDDMPVIVLEEDQFLPIPPAVAEGDVQNANENEGDRGNESGGSDLTALPTDDEM